jgi:hypothetical protein
MIKESPIIAAKTDIITHNVFDRKFTVKFWMNQAENVSMSDEMSE